MTVEELIEELKKFPLFMIVTTPGGSLVDGVKFTGSSMVKITSHVPN
jgi:hypothetical protein